MFVTKCFVSNTYSDDNLYAFLFYLSVALCVILVPTIPKEDDVTVILEPEPSPQVPEEPPVTFRPTLTGTMSLRLYNEVSGNPGTV
jgi:hypothetical protein